MSKKQKIKTISDVVTIAALNKNTHAYFDYQHLTDDDVSALSKKLKIDLNINKRTICTDEIRHAIKEHSNDDCPLRYEDIPLIDIITRFYDSIKLGDMATRSTSLKVIVYEKIIGDKFFVVEEIRSGRKKLAFKTMYKRKIKKR